MQDLAEIVPGLGRDLEAPEPVIELAGTNLDYLLFTKILGEGLKPVAKVLEVPLGGSILRLCREQL